jgi:hypothetical protein
MSRRRDAVLLTSLVVLALAVAGGAWWLLPPTRSAAMVFVTVPNPDPAIGAATFQKSQIAFAKSRLVLHDAVRRLDPAVLERVLP